MKEVIIDGVRYVPAEPHLEYVSFWRGVPIKELSREEAIAALDKTLRALFDRMLLPVDWKKIL